MKKLIVAVFALLQLIALTTVDAQTYKVQNLQVLGTSQFTGASQFAVAPTFNGNTPWDSGNFNPAIYAPLASPTFTGTPVVPGYLTTGSAVATYAPLASPVFTGTVTIPSGASISGYLTTAAATSTYAALSGATFTGGITVTNVTGPGTGLTGTAAALSIGGNAATATRSTNVSGGTANQIPYQTAANTTAFTPAPTTASTVLTWNGTAFVWTAGGGGGGGSGTVTSVALSPGTTGLTFTGSPITTAGTITAGGTLAVANGGTGITGTVPARAVVIGNGTSAFLTATTGTQGRVLLDMGATTAPAFQDPGPFILTGADPTGVADSTTALQNAINTIVAGGCDLIIPTGTYKISAALSIPAGTGWSIRGTSRGQTVITQATANTPVFDLKTDNGGGVGGHSFRITDLTIAASSAQPATNTKAVGIYFENSASSFFNYQLERLTFTKLYRGIAQNPTNSPTNWGGHHMDLVFNGDMTGSAIYYGSGGTGQPNMSIENIYVSANTIAAGESIINVINNDSGWYNNIEVNTVNNSNTILNLSGQGAIGTVKIEQGTYSAGSSIFVFPNAHFSIGSLSMITLTISATGGAVVGIDGNGGGATTTLNIGQTMMTFAQAIAGTFYLVNSGVAPAYSVRLAGSPQGLIGTANAYLSNIPSANSSYGVSVDEWQQERSTPSIGDANFTWTISNPNVIFYNAPITANRVVTLGDPNGNTTNTNLYDGAKVCVVRSAASTGAFTVAIHTPSGSTLGTTMAATTNGSKRCYMWLRSISNWFVYDSQTF